jgi:bifunctional non-homologous end joining protein LigD
VSAPLHWEEVKKGLHVQDFNIHTIADRIQKEGDPLKPLLGKGINMSRILKKMETL